MPSSDVDAVDTAEDVVRARGLLAEAQKALASGVDMDVPPQRVRPMKGQPRKTFDPEELANLEISIRAAGQWSRGLIRKRGADYELIDGERRLRAVSRIKGRLYRATCVDIADNAVIPYIIALTVNTNRSNLSDPELADAVEYLYDDLRLPIEDVAAAAGITVPKARKLLKLRHVHPDVRALLNTSLPKYERIPLSAAVKIADHPARDQGKLAQRVVRGELDAQTLLPKTGVHSRSIEPSWRVTQGSRMIGFRISALHHAADALLKEMQTPESARALKKKSRDLDPELVLGRLQNILGVMRECQAVVARAISKGE